MTFVTVEPLMSARRLTASSAVFVSLVGVLTVVGASSPAGAVSSTIPSALKTYVTGDRNADQWSLTSTHAAAAWTKATGAGVVVDGGTVGDEGGLSGVGEGGEVFLEEKIVRAETGQHEAVGVAPDRLLQDGGEL